MKAKHYDYQGKQLEEMTLPKEVFEATVSPSLITQAIHVYQANSHQRTSKAKTRGEINLTTAKWFKQKGTGRARHGAKSAPIFVGGGVAHGPKGIKPAVKKLNQKMKRLSVLGALSILAAKNSVVVISGVDKADSKSKNVQTLLNTLAVKKPLMLVASDYQNFKQASKNIKDLSVVVFNSTNAYQLLKTKSLLIDNAALPQLASWLTAKGTKEAVQEPKKVVKKAAPKTAAPKKLTKSTK